MFKRGKIWYFSIGGTPESSGTDNRKDAQKLYDKRKREAFDRKNGFYVKLWEEADRDWLVRHQHLDSFNQQAAHSKWWLAHLQGKRVNTINAELVRDIIQANRQVNLKGKSKKNTTANIYTDYVSKILRAEGIRLECVKYQGQGRSTRWLTPEQWQQLIPNMGTDLLDLGMFALATGLRKTNCTGFEWAWVHGDKAYLPPEVTKTDQPYGIPLNKTAQAIIERRRRMVVRHQQYVFTHHGKPWKLETLREALKAAVRASGIEHMSFHTFRHTFASWLAQKGVSDTIRKRLGCWTTGGDASSGYVHFDVESLRPFAGILDGMLIQENDYVGKKKVEAGIA